MTTFNVSNATELNSAIASAGGGDRIVLADGNYGAVYVTNRTYASTLTIEAATPGAGAHLDGLFVSGAKNISFVGLDVGRALNAGEPTYTQLAYLRSSNDIKFSGMTFHGSQDGDPSNDGVGLTVLNGSGLNITNSRFEELYRGIVLQNSTNSTIKGNDVTLIRSDGIISVANDGLSIEGNHIGDFRQMLGDHSDAIQFWNTGQTKGQTNITIKDNVIFQTYFSGIDQTGTQGIFISDPLTYGYKNILIQNNVLYSNDAYNGIFLNGVTGAQVLDNTVLSKSTDAKFFWIDVLNSTDVSVQRNITDNIITSNNTGFFQSGNVNFTVDPSARALVPNLINPTSEHDLISSSGVGYHLPISAPPSPVSSAVGNAIGSMLTKAGGTSLGHATVADAGTVPHDMLSPSTSPTLDLSGLKSAVVSVHPTVQPQVEAVHAFLPSAAFHLPPHMLFDHFVALP